MGSTPKVARDQYYIAMVAECSCLSTVLELGPNYHGIKSQFKRQGFCQVIVNTGHHLTVKDEAPGLEDRISKDGLLYMRILPIPIEFIGTSRSFMAEKQSNIYSRSFKKLNPHAYTFHKFWLASIVCPGGFAGVPGLQPYEALGTT